MDVWLGVRVLNQAPAGRQAPVGLQRRRCGCLRGEADSLPYPSQASESPLSMGDITRYHSASLSVSIGAIATSDPKVGGSSPSGRTTHPSAEASRWNH
jgi:hypothetical protein